MKKNYSSIIDLLLLSILLFTLGCKKNEEAQNVLKDIEGNTYKTVTIGTQVWMASNLKTTKYIDGTVIPLASENSAWNNKTTPAYCWYNNDASISKSTYGAMYNWYTVNTGKLCPAGWHVPSNADWTTLITFLGGEFVAGGKLKEIGTIHWLSPNTGATNENGFTALPGGNRYSYGEFSKINTSGIWWSSDDTTQGPWYSNMESDNSKVYRGNVNRSTGFSVRCIKD